MQLMIAGDVRTFVPLNSFCTQHQLPADFGVALFEPKAYVGLGSIEAAGDALPGLRQRLLEAMPDAISLNDGLAHVDRLQMGFERELWAINPQIGLREQEIAFATAGLGAVLSAWFYALRVAHARQTDAPRFEAIYGEWLHDTLQVTPAHEYAHAGAVWQVHIIHHAYGRVGLFIEAPHADYYVADGGLACPAQGFMHGLLAALCARFAAALG